MGNLTTTAQPGKLQLSTIEDFLQLGEIMEASGLANRNQARAAAGKLIIGHELGLTSFESMRYLYIINGKAEVASELMAARIKSSGRYDYKIIELTETACDIQFFDKGKLVGNSRFTIEDAKKAELVTRGGMFYKYPRNMLYNRALSNGRRWYAPDVLSGAYTEGEISDMKQADAAAPDVPAEIPAEVESQPEDKRPPKRKSSTEHLEIFRAMMEDAKPSAKGEMLRALQESPNKVYDPVDPETFGDRAIKWCCNWIDVHMKEEKEAARKRAEEDGTADHESQDPQQQFLDRSGIHSEPGEEQQDMELEKQYQDSVAAEAATNAEG